MDDIPDDAITWFVLDFIDKVVVCSSAWWRMADQPSKTPILIAGSVGTMLFRCLQKTHCYPAAKKRSNSAIGIMM
jgi:hypothetical protein